MALLDPLFKLEKGDKQETLKSLVMVHRLDLECHTVLFNQILKHGVVICGSETPSMAVNLQRHW